MIKWKTFAIGCSLALALLLIAQHKPSMPDPNVYRAVIDLTHNLNDHSPNWEGSEQSPFQARESGNIERDGYYSRDFTTPEHYGTHLDAPAHFAKGMWTVDQIPVERLVRPLVVLDVRSQAQKQSRLRSQRAGHCRLGKRARRNSHRRRGDGIYRMG